jgi:tetratricopeptide (TPR) repeat protein
VPDGDHQPAFPAPPTLRPEQWALVEQLFDDASVLPPPARAPFVNNSSAEPAVRAEVLRLLARWDDARQWFSHASASVAALASAPFLSPGDLLASRFRISRFIARGGMGEVYEAADQTLSGTVALKLLRPSLAARPSLVDRFRREIQLARDINSPFVCRVFDIDHHLDAAGSQLHFYTMQLLAGPTLAAHLQSSGPIPLPAARPIIRDLALGLDAAHRLGILHRDFKPGNVILTPAGPVITDFGLALHLAGSIDSFEAATPAYASPEQLAGQRLTVASDIYSFGVVLHEILTGHRPSPAGPTRVPAIVAQCLALSPARRPSSVLAVAAALGAAPANSPFPRRYWLLTPILALAGAAAYQQFAPQPRVAARDRILLLPAPEGHQPTATVRALLAIALTQSPRLSVVTDPAIRTALAGAPIATLPSRTRATVQLSLHLSPSPNGLHLHIRAERPGSPDPLFTIDESSPDPLALVPLADAAARRIRAALGESDASLRMAHSPLESVTSTVPEAVDAYFRGVHYYERSDATAALAYFDRALALDPSFALAHTYRGLCLGVAGLLPDAAAADERAMSLRSRLPERERLWIETAFHAGRFDYESAALSLRRLASLDPADSMFQRQLAFCLTRSGAPHEAVPFARRAVALDPFGSNNRGQLIMILVEAGQPAEALAAYNASNSDGLRSPVIDEAAALAHWLADDLAPAEALLRRTAQDSGADAASLFLASLLAYLGRWPESIALLDAELARLSPGPQSHLFRAERLVQLAWSRFLLDDPAWSSDALLALSIPADPFTLEPIKEAGLLAAWAANPQLLDAAISAARHVDRQWPTNRTRGIATLLESCRAFLDGADASAGFHRATRLWPAPTSHLWAGRAHALRHSFPAALASFTAMDAQSGSILRRFPSVARILGWLESARAHRAAGQSQQATALAARCLALWQPNAPHAPIVRRIRSEFP